MTHTAANDTLPAQVGGTSPGAPWIATILEGLALTIERQCGDAWDAIAPGEPIVKTTIPQSPVRWRWNPESLPGLFVWAERGGQSVRKQIAQDIAVRMREVHVLWLPPPSVWSKSEQWTNFWVAIDNAIALALESDYSPWTTRTAIGLPIRDKAGLWALELGEVEQRPVQLPTLPDGFEAWLWKLNAQVRVGFDVTASPTPVVPNKVDIITSVRTGEGDDTVDTPLFESQLPPESWQ